MQTTLNIPYEKMRQFQELVKAFDLRFIFSYPDHPAKCTYFRVCVDGQHLPIEKCNEFWRAWRTCTQPLVEKESATGLKQIIRRLKGRLKLS